MQTMFYEIKKMYIVQKGLIFALLFVLLNDCILLVWDKPTNQALEENINQYYAYLDMVNGKLTSESEQYLQAEARKLDEAKIGLDRLYEDYYDVKIGSSEFTDEQNHLENILSNNDGFEQIFEQYVFVRENPHNRYMSIQMDETDFL